MIGDRHDREHDASPVNTPACGGVPEEDRDPAEDVCEERLDRASCMNGPRTKIPQRPMTTLGTAASISISEPIGPRIDRRRELAQEETDRDRERRRDQDRAERGDERADDELARAEDAR